MNALRGQWTPWAVAVLVLSATNAAAQRPSAVGEANAEERREALKQLWDAAPGSTEARTGVTFGKWLAEQGRAVSLAAPTGLPGRWTSIGPFGFYGDNGFFGSMPQLDAGRVPTVAFHPTDRNIIYVGTSAGGLWRTSNEGASWVPLTDNQCSMVIGAVAVDPVNPNIVYAGTGEIYETSEGCGVLRSTDGGTTWTNIATAPFTISLANNARFYSIVIDRSTAGSATATTLVTATNFGVYRSTDSGRSWTLVTPGLTFSDVVQHPTNPNVMYAVRQGVTGSTTPGGLWRSSDRGATWASVSAFDANAVGRIEIAVSAARPGSVWMVVSSPTSTFYGLFRWDDATSSRTTLSATGVTAPPAVSGRNNFGAQGNYDLMIAADPGDANKIYLGGVRAYRSLDGGLNFTEMAPNIHCDWHVVVVDPNDSRRILAGSDGGLFLSRDGGASFLSLNAGLATSLHYPGMSLHPTDPSGVLTGLQDNGTILARNGLGQWNGVFSGDGAFTAINPVVPEVYYVSSQNGNIARLDARTGSSRGATSGIPSGERRAFIAPFVIDPNRPTRLYFGGAHVYRTENEGTFWTAISGDLTLGSGVISAIAVAPNDTTRLYAGTNDGRVHYSGDFGTTWALATTTLPARSVGDIAVDPANARRAVVTFTSSGTGHVYLTIDGGANWTNITGSLPDITTQAAAWGSDGRLFVGNMFGVYESADAGSTWSRMQGLPTIRITDLVYNATTRRLVAATYGRGIWAYDFNTAQAVLRGDVNADGSVNAADALVIQQALVGIQVQPTVQLYPRADANCDGKVEILDALLVLRFAVGASVNAACVGTIR